MKQPLIALSLAFGALVGCQNAGDPASQAPVVAADAGAQKPILSDPQTFNEADEKACTAFGGSYTRAGFLGYYHCFVSYADGGEVCSDSSECEGRCMATNASGYDPDAPDGQTGTCQKTDNPFGCFSAVVKGRVQPGLCVD